ncbi:MAG: DUF72 domain-containing protein [Niabella sp.]|nr:DUF72 domain-containing protein [Niabella sp.]
MLYIGTSGYSYSYWKGRFYPDKLPASGWLEYYATQFNTLELNNTFYRFPAVEPLKKSASRTPADFRFSVKAHKILTHTRRLAGVKDKIQEFTDIVQEGLEQKLSCILYQMPPSYAFSEARLADVIEYLSPDKRNVIEFRHVSWWQSEVFDLLTKHRINFCSVSYPGLPDDNIITGDFLYRRMHGVPELFKSPYSEKELTRLLQELQIKKNAFIYFNNTMFESGYTNAYFLKQQAASPHR